MNTRRLLVMAVATAIVVATAAAAYHLTSRSKRPEIVTIGVVNLAPVLDPILDGFKEGMAAAGYVEGRDIRYVYQGPAGAIDKIDASIQTMLDAKPDIILSLSTPVTQKVKQATAQSKIPVVFAPLQDPLASGIVPSLSHPGGNLTGVLHGLAHPRRLEWLLAVKPDIRRVYVPYNSEDAAPVIGLKQLQEVAPMMGVELLTREARTQEEITAAIAEIPQDVDAVFILGDSLVASRLDDIVAATIARKLPFSPPNECQVEAGALISYGFNFNAVGKQAAGLAVQILKGVDPADLPVETPEFLVVINLRTAKAIGLEIPDEVLRQANRIIR